jgi:hypothetical protein
MIRVSTAQGFISPCLKARVAALNYFISAGTQYATLLLSGGSDTKTCLIE